LLDGCALAVDSPSQKKKKICFWSSAFLNFFLLTAYFSPVADAFDLHQLAEIS